MPNSIKFLLFCLVGCVVFLAIGFFLPIVMPISTWFGLFTGVSLVVFVFQSLKTRHHFLKSAIGFGIMSIFSLIMRVTYYLNHKLVENVDLLNSINEYILNKAMILCFTFALASLVIYLLDLFFGLFGLVKDRDLLPIKFFRLSVYWTYIVCSLGIFGAFILELKAISQALLLLMIIFDIIFSSVVLIKLTTCHIRIKLISMNFIALLTAMVYLGYMYYTGDAITRFVPVDGFSAVFVSKLICNLWTITIIIQFLIYMLISIFKTKVSVLSCFIPIIYAVFGLTVSGFVYYNTSLLPYNLEFINPIYYMAIYIFAIGVGVSLMSATYKLIFTKTKSAEVQAINIDDD